MVLYTLIFIFLDSKLEDKTFCNEGQHEFPDFNLLLISSRMQFRFVRLKKNDYGEWIIDTYHSSLQDLGMSMEELVVPVHQTGAAATICEPHHLSLGTVACNHCMLLIEDQLHKIITGGSAL